MGSLTPDGFPLPPPRLIARAGATPGRDVVEQYLTGGAANKQTLEALVATEAGTAWFAGRRVLDFGCGAGKVLRHLGAEAKAAEIWGCDIDADSIEWLEHHLCPPFHVFKVSDEPRVPQPDDHFDLIYAISVFTHVAEDWAAWLLELHRVLKPDGVLVITFLGEGMIAVEHGGAWDPDRIGMNVLRHGQDWDGGGPTVFHSDWWIRAHWGRAFEIRYLHHDLDPAGVVVPGSHGYAVMRKRPGRLRPAELAALDPGEPRELAALQHNIEQLHGDDRRLRELLAAAQARGDAEHAARVAAEAAAAAQLQEQLVSVSSSHSWRLTKPLRTIADRARGSATPGR